MSIKFFVHDHLKIKRLAFAGMLLFLCSFTEAQTHVQYPAVWGRFIQAADQSSLNQPLTDADLVSVKGPHFMTVGPDGKAGTRDDKRVRFFGINLIQHSAFPSPTQALSTGATLRSLGFNAVRLHHLDTIPTADPGVFRSVLTTGPYPSFHEGAVNRLKAFISVLKQEGMYVNLNLMVGYDFRPKEDNVPAYDEKNEILYRGSPAYVFHPRLVELQVKYAQELLKRLALGSDPVLAQVEIINESSLAAAWIRWDPKHWERLIRGPYEVELNRQWKEWLAGKYGTTESACKSWGGCSDSGLSLVTPTEAEALQKSGRGSLIARAGEKASDFLQKTAQSVGLPGSMTKKGVVIHPRVLDFMQFVAATDQKFLDRMRQVVKTATRPDMPVTGTQMSYGAGFSMLAGANMDYVDEHFYGDETEFPAEPWAPWNWKIRNDNVSDTDFPRLLKVSMYRDFSRPFVVSEFGQPFPNRLGPEITPIMSALASQQDWDGLYLYNYVNDNAEQSHINFLNLQGDLGRASLVGLSARMFRAGSIQPLQSTHTIPFTADDVWQSVALRRRPDAWLLHTEREHRQDPYLALQHRIGYGSPITKNPSESTSVSAFRHTPSERQLTINAPQVSGVFGGLSADTRAQAGSLSVEMARGQPREFVTFFAHSLDQLPIRTSSHILIGSPGFVVGTQPGSMPARPQKMIPYKGQSGWWTLEPSPPQADHPSSMRRALPPLWLERKIIKVALDSPHRGLTVYPLGPLGQRLAALPLSSVVKTPTGFSITLNATPNETALWFELIGSSSEKLH